MKILDATCGARSIWYQKKHPLVIFMDIRNETIHCVASKKKNSRKWIIKPDIVADFRCTPFPDNYFDMVVFDPPHLIRKRHSKPSSITQKYGIFLESEYRSILSDGFQELFRILKPDGVLIFKWSDITKKLEGILKLSPYKPLFGTRTGQRNNVHWILFIKYRLETTLQDGGWLP